MLGAAIGSPLLGRGLDRYGLKPVLALTTAAEAVFWALAAVLDYTWLIPAGFVLGLMGLPVFTISARRSQRSCRRRTPGRVLARLDVGRGLLRHRAGGRRRRAHPSGLDGHAVCGVGRHARVRHRSARARSAGYAARTGSRRPRGADARAASRPRADAALADVVRPARAGDAGRDLRRDADLGRDRRRDHRDDALLRRGRAGRARAGGLVDRVAGRRVRLRDAPPVHRLPRAARSAGRPHRPRRAGDHVVAARDPRRSRPGCSARP